MAESKSPPARTLLLVGLIAVVAAVLVTASYNFSKDRIAANQRVRLIRSLHSVLDPSISESRLNPILLELSDAELLGSDDAIDVFVVTENGRAIATIFAAFAPDGYHAPIQLLIGIAADERITGVRVVSHRETPGLGDAIDIKKSDWITQFDGRSLQMPPLPNWAVDEDAGSFDSITGATVTSRAVVTAVKNTLLYFQDHKEELFGAALRAEQLSDGTPND